LEGKAATETEKATMSDDRFSKKWEEMREEYSRQRDPFAYDLAGHFLSKWLRASRYAEQEDQELRAQTLREGLLEMKSRYYFSDDEVERVRARVMDDDIDDEEE